jgi:hypothetical protein
MTVSPWLHICACDQIRTPAATCYQPRSQDCADASLRCLQCYGMEPTGEDRSSPDPTAAVSCSIARDCVGAEFIGETGAVLACITSARFSVQTETRSFITPRRIPTIGSPYRTCPALLHRLHHSRAEFYLYVELEAPSTVASLGPSDSRPHDTACTHPCFHTGTGERLEGLVVERQIGS